MPKYKETKLRTFTKAILLRVIVFSIITVTTVYVFGQGIIEGLEFAILDVIIELLVHYVYDRFWIGIEWGLEEEEDVSEDKEREGV